MLKTQFKHSIKVPRLYKLASTVAKNFKEGKGSIKQLVFQQKHPNIKAIQSLVITLVKKLDELDRLLKKSQFLTKESRCDPWLAKILIVELLWGKGCLNGQSKPECTVRAYEQIFKAHLSDENQDWDDEDKTEVLLKPRYVRVNTLLITVKEVIEGFQNEGWELLEVEDKVDYNGFLEKVKSLSEGTFLTDIHIPNLLIFPPKTEFFKHPAYKKGYIVLQDKASCLPVHILDPQPGSIVLDMCAAPGMKTTHLAAHLQNTGTVYAVERNPRRFELLNNIVGCSGATCIKTFNKDVLTCYKTDFPDVKYILVDPSCSGSGMTDRQDFQEKLDVHRLEKLAGFQIKILRSALTRYPNVQRVVYSTCSIYTEENEDVVRQVLETNYNFKLIPAKQYLNNAWASIGSPDFGEIGEFCLYAQPKKDYTNGFFVAVFERLKEDESNQFFNDRIFNFKKDSEIQQRKQNKFNKKKLKRDMDNSKFINKHTNYDDLRNSDDNLIKSEEMILETNQQHFKQEKKKKIQKASNDIEENVNIIQETQESIKKKKKNDVNIIDVIELNEGETAREISNLSRTSKHKKKKRKNVDSSKDQFNSEKFCNEIMNNEDVIVEKNIKEAVGDIQNIENSNEHYVKKKKKHTKVDKIDNSNFSEQNVDNLKQTEVVNNISDSKKGKHKKKKSREIENESETLQVLHKRKKKERHNFENLDDVQNEPEVEMAIKQKKRKEMDLEVISSPYEVKYRKKKRNTICETIEDVQEPEMKTKLKKKKTAKLNG